MNSITQAASLLLTAAQTRRPTMPVRDLIGSTDIAAAYAVQQRLTEARLQAGARIVGRKIGLTSRAVQAQLGVDRPDFGVLFNDMDVADAATTPMNRLLQPKVEAEIAFVLGADLDREISEETVRAAIDHAMVAIEIVDSRIANWDITFGDTVADNASAGLYVLGSRRLSLDEFEPRDTVMGMRIDGELVSTGNGEACLGDPLNALRWLAATARDLGDPLRAGQVILSGALGPMVPIQAGQRVEAFLASADERPLGTVSTTFVGGEA